MRLSAPAPLTTREHMPRVPPPPIKAGLLPRSRCSHRSSPAVCLAGFGCEPRRSDECFVFVKLEAALEAESRCGGACRPPLNVRDACASRSLISLRPAILGCAFPRVACLLSGALATRPPARTFPLCFGRLVPPRSERPGRSSLFGIGGGQRGPARVRGLGSYRTSDGNGVRVARGPWSWRVGGHELHGSDRTGSALIDAGSA